MKSGLEGRNNRQLRMSPCLSVGARVSMKSGLEGRNNLSQKEGTSKTNNWSQ